LEPLLIIVVGLIIGSLVIILYLPIFNLGQIV
jgi:type IV pilus assembly protein PilC